MTVQIRLMTEQDVDAVREIEAEAFGAWWRSVSGDTNPRPFRTRANMLSNRERDPEGCFVAQAEGKTIGYIFSRTWGSEGWFGTFGVRPEHQRRGAGKRLIAASVEYLRRDPHRIIGLETMPDSPYNLGLYMRLGFQPRFLTLRLGMSLEPGAALGPDLPTWSAADDVTRECWLADWREAAGHIRPGLDYSKEVLITARFGLGETLALVEGERAIGLSTVWLAGVQEGVGQDTATVHVLVLHPVHTTPDTFQTLLDASRSLAQAHGKTKLMLLVNAQHAWALEQLLAWGCRVERPLVRMALCVKGTEDSSTTDSYVNCSRWSG